MNDYRPRSIDALFATILERMEAQGLELTKHRDELKLAMHQVLIELRSIEARVSALEKDRSFQKGAVAVIAGLAGLFGAGAIEWVKTRMGGK